jgi:hypothetical protein
VGVDDTHPPLLAVQPPTRDLRFPTPFLSPPAAVNPKNADCYLGLLYTMDDVAVYGYITPVKMKMVLAFALSDAVVRDADVTAVRAHRPTFFFFV